VAANPLLVSVLQSLSEWTAADACADALGFGRRAAVRFLNRLAEHGILERSAGIPVGASSSVWDVWGPAAGLLHFSTRNRQFAGSRAASRQLGEHARASPPPASLKSYPGRLHIDLPESPTRRSRFAKILADRRTWRQFGERPVTIDALSSLLRSTFGVQRWVDLASLGRVMLRSSPSGGARHPIEAYLVVRKVSGLASGTYHYNPDRGNLVRLRARPITERTVSRMLGGQTWYGKASALVVLTAVFARTAWVYRSARAYRAVLLEAGHFCQTFCLAATESRLAPFCTGAFSEAAIESALRVDGIEESVMYVAGVGTRPRDVTWAPLPSGESGLV
jgi:SagB-type dehydrogenase family enzyme